MQTRIAGIAKTRMDRLKLVAVSATAAALALFLGLLLVRVSTGQSLGLKSSISAAFSGFKSLIFTVSDGSRVRSRSRGQFTNIIFLHHSVGSNLIEQGSLRQRFAAAGFDFSDHGYNGEGLRGPAGIAAGYSYSVPGDNTDPAGLARLFAQPVYPLPLNTLSALMQYEVIIFKSCFPNSNIVDDPQLAQVQKYYLSIRDGADEHKDKIFILLTTPPLNPAETNPEAAARARAMANWLRSDTYLLGHSNLFVFDLFDNLAERDPASPEVNRLAQAYREGSDSHPNRAANETIGPLFVDFVTQAVQRYRALYAMHHP